MSFKLTKIEKKETLRHYWRMRAWAKKQEPEEYPLDSEMCYEIGETWFQDDCFLCLKYGKVLVNGDTCVSCPLAINHQKCFYQNSLWDKIYRSKTWREWIENVNNFIKMFLELPVEERI
jgi:hypothetical protein